MTTSARGAQVDAPSVTLSTRLGRRRRRGLYAVTIYTVLIILTIIFTAPIIWMVLASFQTTGQIVQVPAHWIVWPPTFENYPSVATAVPLLRYVGNSLFLSVSNVIGVLFSSSLVAYSFSRLRWPGRDIVFGVMVATVLLPSTVTLIPVYLIWRNLHLINTYWPLIVPSFFGNPFYIFLLRQFMLGIPQEYADAARIDGASEARIMTSIVLPLAIPALAAISVFTFINTWEDFFLPLIYLDDPNRLTMALALQQFVGSHVQDWGPLMAGVVIFILPILFLFVVAQRFILEGVTFSGSSVG
jgi:ABC-type glycerol-3-phosphate transport system permease component